MQIIVNALGSAAIIAPAAVGFSLIFALFRFANFAIGTYLTVGAFGTWVANQWLGLPLALSAAAGMLAACATVTLSDVLVFRPIRSASAVTLLLASIALSFVLENLLRFVFGSQMKGFDLPLSRPLVFGPIHLAPEQLLGIGVSAAVLALLLVGLALLPWGRALRAAADDPSLAGARGVNIRRVHLYGLALAGLLAGLSGTLAGVDLAIDPAMGGTLTIPVLAAAILGGVGSIPGAIAGAVLVGVAEELAVLSLGAVYKAGVGFVIIALVLLLRPQGLFGRSVARA